MKRISYFFFYFIYTTVDRALFTSAQQEYTKRQFSPTETREPLCLPPRTSVNAPSQGSETNCFLLLTLACPWCASSSPSSPRSQSTRLWKYRANHLGKPSCPLGSTSSSPPQSAQYTAWYLSFFQSIYPQINLTLLLLSDEGKMMNAFRIFCKVWIYSQMKQKGTWHLSDAATIWIPLILFAITMSTCTAIASVLGGFMMEWINSICWLSVMGAPVGGHVWTQPGVFASTGKVHVCRTSLSYCLGLEGKGFQEFAEPVRVLNIKDLHVFSICSVRK